MANSKKLLFTGGAIFTLIIVLLGIAYYFGIFEPHMQLHKRRFDQLPGWTQDDQTQALLAFQQSCSKILNLPANTAFGKLSQMAQTYRWQTICRAANQITHPDQISARRFFENWFDPYQIKNNFNTEGLFTGYYLPLIQGNTKSDKIYTIPIYGLPNDLIKVDLGLFNPEFSGKYVVGRIKDQRLIPYPDRAAIVSGAIHKRAPVLFWTHDAVKLFFAQIQGSFLLQLPNQQLKLLGYAGENGRPYTAIGKILVDNKALSKKSISMETIQNWLAANPEHINRILNQDASYVFFKVLTLNSPLGKQQVPLTAQRSLAIDNNYIPLGAPIWVTTEIPQKNSDKFKPYQRLFIAQDVGGAIKGIVRADIYFGPGSEAEFLAGHMKQRGQYWILLPKS